LSLKKLRSVSVVQGVDHLPGVFVPHPIRVLLVGALSVATGLMVAFVLSLIEQATDVALYGFSAALVIPVGAIGCGLVAAVGFYAASKVLHVRAAGPALIIPLMTAIATFFATHWFTFTQYELPTGKTFAEAMALDGLGFVDYLRMVATESGVNMDASSGLTSIERLGSWGYALAALEIAGFALGGWFVSAFVRQNPWCEASRRFMKPMGRAACYFDDPDRFEATANHLVDVLERGGPIAAMEHATAERSTVKRKRKARFCVLTNHFECAHCGVRHTVVATQVYSNNNWTQLSQTPLHPGGEIVDDREAQLIS